MTVAETVATESASKDKKATPFIRVSTLYSAGLFTLGAAALVGPRAIVPALLSYTLMRPIKYTNSKDFTASINAMLLFTIGFGIASWAFEPGKTYRRIFYPEEIAQTTALEVGGSKIFRGETDETRQCDPIYGFSFFGEQGPRLGNRCATIKLVKRDGLNFIATVKFDHEPSPRLMAFRPKDSNPAPGYDPAVLVPNQ